MLALFVEIPNQGHYFWGQWKGDKGLNNTIYNNVGLVS